MSQSTPTNAAPPETQYAIIKLLAKYYGWEVKIENGEVVVYTHIKKE